MFDYIKVSYSASSFASHVHDLHKKVMDKIVQSNTNYKLRADIRKRLKTFNVGDYVMVKIRPEWLLSGTVKKLYVCSPDPFQILKKLNDNAYAIDLPQDFGISFIFKIEDLVYYKGTDFNSDNPLDDKPSLEPISERHSLPLLSNILSNTI